MKSQQRFHKISHEEAMARKPTAQQVRLRKRSPIYVVLDNIRSLYNIGAMFRTADAALVDKVFLTGVSGRPPHKEIDKVALGATDVVPWEYCLQADVLVKRLKESGFFIVALEQTKESVSYEHADYTFPLCLIVGNEITGVDEALLALCDAVINIPMLGRATSLNVATAYGIALFEILRQYRCVHDRA